jgi:alkylation response protein AidB-like acyl-CoA dehydrogenase
MEAPTITATEVPPVGTLRQRIEPHLESIAERAQATEDLRRVPDENIAAITEAGFVRSFAPRHVGGDERNFWDYLDGVRAVSEACPSTGWVTGVLNVHQSMVANFGPEVRNRVWADGPDAIICSSGTPVMKATLVDGGVVLNGRGRWSSGCQHAEWALVGFKVPDLTDSQYPERNYRPSMFLAHKSEYTIDDTWYTESMRGTGSNDLVFDNLFVEQSRIEDLAALTFGGLARGAAENESWPAKLPIAIHFSAFFPAVALGCADGMIKEFMARTRFRKNAYSDAPGILNPASHHRLAESVHEVESLTAYYKQIADDIQEAGMQGEDLSQDRWHELLQRIPFVAARAVNVVNRLFEGAGSSAIASGGKMQRYWRDAQACRLHTAMDYDTAAMLHGRAMMGLMPTRDL